MKKDLFNNKKFKFLMNCENGNTVLLVYLMLKTLSDKNEVHIDSDFTLQTEVALMCNINFKTSSYSLSLLKSLGLIEIEQWDIGGSVIKIKEVQ